MVAFISGWCVKIAEESSYPGAFDLQLLPHALVLVYVLKLVHAKVFVFDVVQRRGVCFLPLMGRWMVQCFGRCDGHLSIFVKNPCTVQRECTIRSSSVFLMMRERAVGAKLPSDSCVLCSSFLIS